MPAAYHQTNELDEIIADLVERKTYHRELHIMGVTVQVLFYHHEEPLKVRGVRAYAYIKLTNLKERALGQKDATIVVDNASWEIMDDERRVALVDHELYHLALCKDKDGKNATDDLNRPKMRLRKHDIEVGWFVEIAAEHKEHSIEVMQATQIANLHRQTLFAFALGDGSKSSGETFTGDPITSAASATEKFVRGVEKMVEGSSVTISGAGKSVTIKGKGKAE